MMPINIARNCMPSMLVRRLVYVIETKDGACFDKEGEPLYYPKNEVDEVLSRVEGRDVRRPIVYSGSNPQIHVMKSMASAKEFVRKHGIKQSRGKIRWYTIMDVRPEQDVFPVPSASWNRFRSTPEMRKQRRMFKVQPLRILLGMRYLDHALRMERQARAGKNRDHGIFAN